MKNKERLIIFFVPFGFSLLVFVTIISMMMEFFNGVYLAVIILILAGMVWSLYEPKTYYLEVTLLIFK